MKAFLLTFSLLAAFLPISLALDIVTPEGTFKDVVVKKVVGEAVSITHSEGTALVDFDFLPPAMQAQYEWTPEKSEARKAAKVAEAKRIADEEKMIEEAPMRKAKEEEAKRKAEADKLAAEEKAKRRVENAAFEAEASTAQSDLIAAAAKARADIDRERKGGKGKVEEIPVAAVISDSAKEGSASPATKRNVVTPPFGTVADVISTENPFFKNAKVWIGLGVGLLVVILLFMMPSSSPKKARRR